MARNSSCLAAEAVACLRGMRKRSYDVTGAYLQGNQLASEQVLVRPPPGFRTYDERGVEMLWLMNIPLYGQQDAGAIWNRTYNEYVTGKDLGFERCSHDPCVYSKSTKGDGGPRSHRVESRGLDD